MVNIYIYFNIHIDSVFLAVSITKTPSAQLSVCGDAVYGYMVLFHVHLSSPGAGGVGVLDGNKICCRAQAAAVFCNSSAGVHNTQFGNCFRSAVFRAKCLPAYLSNMAK